MSEILESSTWENTIYRIAKEDLVLGGAPIIEENVVISGVANIATQQLTNRTNYLKIRIEDSDANIASLTIQMDTANTNIATAAHRLDILEPIVASITEAVVLATDDARESAQAADVSASDAAVSAASAATSATSCATALPNATAAAASATSAATSATSAATSATSAATSATSATASKNNAATSETNAAASASSASTSATNANSSKNAAATSATNAATSATAAATSASDAATSATSATTSKNAAATSATNAATSETNAAGSATAANTSKNAAATSATAASGSATAAATSATASATSATNSLSSANNAAVSETNAATSATAAAGSATASAASATAASGSTNAAATSATAASASATAAATSATAAATSATNAATSETNAAGSATAAAGSVAAVAASATAAATSATNAATSATAASGSATAAAGSVTSAATSATNAAASATAASGSATAAAGSASTASTNSANAVTSATAASGSATAAATSATAASTSATNAATSETNAASSASVASTNAASASTSATAAASSASAAANSAAEALSYSVQHYRGYYTTYAALVAGVATPIAGDYADVDAGNGSDAKMYIWDTGDSAWVVASAPDPMTSTQVKVLYEANPNTNAYTDADKAKLATMSSTAYPGLAIASTLNIGSTDSNTINITNVTGTLSVTSFGTANAGVFRRLIFQGPATSKTLVYNATSMIIPGSANLQITAGMVIETVSLGSGNWRVTAVTKADGTPVVNPAYAGGTLTTALNEATAQTVAIASNTIPAGSATANTLILTSGDASINVTSLGTGTVGAKRTLINQYLAVLFYTGGNIDSSFTFYYGDVAEFTYNAFSALWVLTGYTTKTPVYDNVRLGGLTGTPQAKLDIAGSSTNANSAPIKLRSGTNMTAVENGAFEYDGTSLNFTIGGARRLLASTTSNLGTKLDATANAVSATKLVTARNINGVAFDGTADINVISNGSGYIEGLVPTYISLTSFSISPGIAYVPGSNKNITVPSTITLSGLSLTANTWYYAYLYDNAGTAAIEFVTTTPSSSYSGTARTKAGDTTRRFVCALKTGSGGLYPFIWAPNGLIQYLDSFNAAPFRCLTGVATTATTVSLSGAVPPTTRTAEMMLSVAAGTSTYDIYVTTPDYIGKILRAVSAGTTSSSRLHTVMPTDAGQNVSYLLTSAPSGSTANIDVTGYGNDR